MPGTGYREKEWICKSRCQVSDRLHFFAEYFDSNETRSGPSATTVYARSAFCTRPAFYSQSAFYPWSALTFKMRLGAKPFL